MKKIICNGDFNNLEIGKDGKGIIVVRTFGLPEFNAGRTPNRFESTVLKVDDWHEFSLTYHARVTADMDGYYVPDINYNFFAGREATYNQVINLLLTQQSMKAIGICEEQRASQKIQAVDEFLAHNKDKLTEFLREEVEDVMSNQSEYELHVFRYKNGYVYRASSLADLVKIQFANTGKHISEYALVLVGDKEVKHFLNTKGKELLGQIEPIKHSEQHLGDYRKSIYRKIEDAVSESRDLFPEAYKTINMGNEN